MRKLLPLLAGVALLSCACCGESHRPSDAKADEATRSLYNRLFALRDRGVMLGHQDDIAYGHQNYHPGFSDVYDMTGDYPAVTGWEVGHIELGAEFSLDSVYFDNIRRGIAAVADRGGISTVSWHCDNILTGGSTWDCNGEDVIRTVLPGGENHDEYLRRIDRLADFLCSLKGIDGKRIPVILRLYHEQTRSWFWWGADYSTPDEYKELWRMTVTRLRDERGVHNVLYAYSPTELDDEDAYLERYPGDEWVDVIGFDYYQFGNDSTAFANYQEVMRRNLKIVTDYAARSGKLPIMAETGYEGIPAANWFTSTLAPVIKGSGVAWVLFWRDAWEPDKPGHFYLPFKGSSSEADFKAFISDDSILMNSDIL